MPVAASSGVRLEPLEGLGSQLRGWGSARVVAGLTNRRTDPSAWLGRFRVRACAEAEQVHGAGIAVVTEAAAAAAPVAGCDALVTGAAGVALRIRTADCLPIFFLDPVRSVVGLAHAGWRGLAASLPARMVGALRHVFHSEPGALQVAIGPSIRPCCYEVGPEFAERFGPFVQERDGRRTCDLIGVAVEQLRRCGVRADRIVEARRCTACETSEWFSLRREGRETGRLTSFIMLRG
ncbi:MAG: peptidoglycan editing factor PgeF [Candidatus Omnitrophica bacterium]|nr:peptidoglycan editing factor PgeF [Candidatus Omnitrophota bacterium]